MMAAVPFALAAVLLLEKGAAVSHGSSVAANGFISQLDLGNEKMIHQHEQHVGTDQYRTQRLSYHGMGPGMVNDNATAALALGMGPHTVINAWACALMCASHVIEGWCQYEDKVGTCEFIPGKSEREMEITPNWASAPCVPGYLTSKCSSWQPGKFVRLEKAKIEPGSLGLTTYEMAWEDEFDEFTCVPDHNGILRPNPKFWSNEIGYKRGKELQWYTPDATVCKDGSLVITAKRQRDYRNKADVSCPLKNHDQSVWFLDNATCEQCAPPTFKYYDPCDLLQTDGSGAPACDCSATAEYTSGSIMTRGKVEFGYGILEIRAKISTGPGYWTNWWLAGDMEGVPWPKNGEIDILDAFQHMLKAGVIHADPSGHPDNAVQHAAARQIDPTWEQVSHTWQLEWTEKFVVVRVDGQETFRLDLSVADPTRTTWPNPFTSGKSFFMIFSLAIGGHSGGDAHEHDNFPVTFEVDYIRYFKQKGHTSR